MKIFEKIDFLMKITNTSNNALSRHLSYDASYISRIRSGKRSLPRKQPFIEPVSLFFAEHIHEAYQIKLAADYICPGTDWPENSRTAQKLIYDWLSQPDNVDSAPIGGILSGISAVSTAALPVLSPLPDENAPQPQSTQFFYGDSGKRQAVALFLAELGQMEHPPQLLLYSNEEFNWMYEDPAFAKKWALLLFQYIKKGGKIKIAHTISRASGEMLVALQKWIPVYMTGAIEPYYYPKVLDRVFRKTLFIAEGHSAIAASSEGEHTENGLNCLIHDPQAVHMLEQEYWDFFEFCKPLMQIFNLSSREKFLDALREFNDDCENMITVRTTPSFYTMPQAVAKSMTERLDNSWILKRQQLSEKAFCAMMDNGNTLTELLNLPPAEQVRQNQVVFPMCDLFDKPGLYYTAGEFIAHLQSVVEKLQQYENYHVVLSSALPQNEIIYVKEDTGVILVKSDEPTIAFAISEQRMISAFWDYLSELNTASGKKAKAIAFLEDYIAQLQSSPSAPQ